MAPSSAALGKGRVRCYDSAFAAIIGLVGCHEGLSTRGGAEEVGRSTTSSVVRSIVLVVAADLFVTVMFFLGD